MLKAKRIAKVMLCICIAFSMFIYVDAEIIYNNGTFNNTSGTAGNTSYIYGFIINFNEGIDLNIGTKYTFTFNIPDYSVNNKSNKYKISRIFSDWIEFDNNNIVIKSQNIDNASFNNNKLIFDYTPSYYINLKELTLYCYSNEQGQTFTINNIINPLVTIDNNIKDNTKDLIYNINNTIINIINYINIVFTFITDKPWIILLGITVSLLSFLIYKAKSII